jgi:hypothetical protein
MPAPRNGFLGGAGRTTSPPSSKRIPWAQVSIGTRPARPDTDVLTVFLPAEQAQPADPTGRADRRPRNLINSVRIWRRNGDKKWSFSAIAVPHRSSILDRFNPVAVNTCS